jgi:hypothetical protein
MLKVAALALCFALLPGVSYAADKITLTCTDAMHDDGGTYFLVIDGQATLCCAHVDDRGFVGDLPRELV